MVRLKKMLETFFPTTEDLTTMQGAFTDEVRPRSPVAAQILRRKLLGVLQMERMRGPDFAPRIDPTGEPVRNRFISLCQRRIDINDAEVDDLRLRLPGIGDTKAPLIFDAVAAGRNGGNRVGSLSALRELLCGLKGTGECTADRWLCFLTCYGRREEAPRHSALFCARDERGRFVQSGATSQ
jgi:hypothetical protein